MNDPRFLAPLYAQVTLIFLVWLWMYRTRLGKIFRDRIHVQDLADPVKFDQHLGSVANPSDNFENQFELPILFIAAMVIFVVTGQGTDLDVRLAWFFVGTRLLHTLIHCTTNRVRYRFAAYALGAISLWTLWGRLIVEGIANSA